MWLIFYMIGIVCTVYLIKTSWQKYQENPVVQTIQRNYNEWKIYLPALNVFIQKNHELLMEKVNEYLKR